MSEAAATTLATICAVATAVGGALSVVRLSGPGALAVLAALSPTASPPAARRLVRRDLRDADGQLLDAAMVAWMPGPASYTGEDVVELHLHGAPAVCSAVLAACRAAGARPAEPGEFTQRAFVHGRMDLAQAEAVAALIAAQTQQERLSAQAQLHGALSRQVGAWQEQLGSWAAQWRLLLDYPLEDDAHEAAAAPSVMGQLAALVDQLRAAAHAARAGPGVKMPTVVLCGPPNAGKSTLLNAWVGHKRVLVAAQAGTTRDPIEVLRPGADPWHLVDTAGVGPAVVGDLLAQASGELSRQWAQRASLALWLLPADLAWARLCGSAGPVSGLSTATRAGRDDERWPQHPWPPTDWPAAHLVLSKFDTLSRQQGDQLRAALAASDLWPVATIAPPVGLGVGELDAWVVGQLRAQRSVLPVGPVRSERVAAHLGRAAEALAAACDELRERQQQVSDVAAMALEAAYAELGELLGQGTSQAVLDRMFSTFCVGK